MLKTKEKDISIETLRGIAIVLVVYYHAVGLYDGASENLANAGQYFNYSLVTLRMPLFATISGFVYSMRPLGASKMGVFLGGKARRILFPYVSVTVLSLMPYGWTTGPKSPWALDYFFHAMIYPFGHLWFLQSMMCVFVCVAVLEKLELLKTPGRWLALFLGLILIAMLGDQVFHSETLNRVFYLAPYFVLGCGFQRHGEMLAKREVIWPAWVLCLLTLGLQQAAWYRVIGDLHILDEIFNFFKFSASASLMLLVFRYRFEQSWLAKLGKYAFSIYLFHFFTLKFGRFVTSSVYDSETFVSGVVSSFFAVVIGLLLPIVFELVIKRNRYASLVLLGLRSRRVK